MDQAQPLCGCFLLIQGLTRNHLARLNLHFSQAIQESRIIVRATAAAGDFIKRVCASISPGITQQFVERKTPLWASNKLLPFRSSAPRGAMHLSNSTFAIWVRPCYFSARIGRRRIIFSAVEVFTWNARPKIPLSFSIVPGNLPFLGSFADPCSG